MRTKISRLNLFVLLLVVVLAVALFAAACGDDEPKPTIKLSDTQFESLWINNAIAKLIIEEGYGYPVETVELSTPVMQVSLAKGDIDLVMELWQQNWVDNYNEETASGNIINLGPTYEGGPQFFMVPKAMADEYNIKTVEDMKAHWALVKDPEDSGKGEFHNCPIGWQCTEINRAYHIRICKSRGHFQFWVDGAFSHGFFDRDTADYPIPDTGKFGFRLIGSDVLADIANLRIHSIEPNERIWRPWP